MLPCPAFSFYWFAFIICFYYLSVRVGDTRCGGLRTSKSQFCPSTTWAAFRTQLSDLVLEPLPTEAVWVVCVAGLTLTHDTPIMEPGELELKTYAMRAALLHRS